MPSSIPYNIIQLLGISRVNVHISLALLSIAFDFKDIYLPNSLILGHRLCLGKSLLCPVHSWEECMLLSTGMGKGEGAAPWDIVPHVPLAEGWRLCRGSVPSPSSCSFRCGSRRRPATVSFFDFRFSARHCATRRYLIIINYVAMGQPQFAQHRALSTQTALSLGRSLRRG